MSQKYLEKDWKTCHGLLGNEKWKKPLLVAESLEPNRKDQNNMTDASEYLDDPSVLEAKMEIVANLIKKSKCVCAYTGAGLSRASGIGDYATKAKNSLMSNVPKLKSAFDAQPTFAHHVISKLEQVGLLHHYVQQNHDGLPQKAGFPQEKLNEIHGAWYDPSNQVVQFNESLRSDLFQWMSEMEKKIDLTLCLGTSLSGMNADRMAWTPAKKFKQHIGNGTIMINLQKTDIDDSCSIRVWATLDDAFKILARKLDLDMTKLRCPPKFDKDVFFIPYDENGKLVKNPKKLMKLDLSEGAEVKIVHPDSSTCNVVGRIAYKYDDHWSIAMKARKNEKLGLYAMGSWWVDLALRGDIDQFSFVNTNPQFVDIQEKEDSIVVGNTHEVINDDSHRWKVYVKSNKRNINQVEFTLHPTFEQQVVTVTKGPFEITRSGWGTFPVGIHVIFDDYSEVELKHDLSFKGNGIEFVESLSEI